MDHEKNGKSWKYQKNINVSSSQIAEKQESMQLTENGWKGPGGSPSLNPDNQNQPGIEIFRHEGNSNKAII